MLIAEGDDRARLGFISLKVTKDVTGLERGHVADLAVNENAPGMGVGSALMHAAGSWARRQGLPMLSLDVWSLNERALSFYCRLAYRAESLCLVKSLQQSKAERSGGRARVGADAQSHLREWATRDPNLMIREASAEDAGKLLRLQHRLDAETPMMMLEPGERSSARCSRRAAVHRRPFVIGEASRGDHSG